MTLVFARFDLLSWAVQKQSLLPLVLVTTVGIMLPVPGLAIIGAALVTSVIVSAPFLGDEKGRLDTLYGLLPVSRRATVGGRTVSLLVYYVAASTVATVATYVIAAARSDSVPVDVVLIAHAVAAAIVGFSLSLQLPVLFRVGFSRGRFIAYAPSMTLAALAWLAQAVGATDSLTAMDGQPVEIVCAVGTAVGVAGVAIGVLSASAGYRQRSL